jgi:tRNA-specific 2-thiouridylase
VNVPPSNTSSSSSRAYSERVLTHLREPVGVGRVDPPDAVGEAGSETCGDLVRITLRIRGGIIEDAAFQAFGCPATIATASESILSLRGADIFEAASLGREGLASRLLLPAHKMDCSTIAADALHGALEDWVRAGIPLVPEGTRRETSVLLAMSGGVDSSAAALYLKDAGLDPIGVTFRLWSDPSCTLGSGCCSPETVMRARRVAHSMGMPHLTVDLAAEFYEGVVEDFVAEYACARTPNPCVVCNAGVRFSALVGLADRLGVGRVSTGHYARMIGEPPSLHRGRDLTKDQAYVLARVPPGLLERVVFPLGEVTKPEARARAREAGLEVHDAAESQEICFIPDDDYRRFLAERLGDRPGAIVDKTGAVLGSHRGAYRFTVGQRKGIGIAAAEPLYVTDVLEDGTVVVGRREDLAVSMVELDGVVRHGPPGDGPLTAQLRSSGLTAEASVDDQGDVVLVGLTTAVVGVARGQTGVVFDGDRVVLAGSISRARP